MGCTLLHCTWLAAGFSLRPLPFISYSALFLHGTATAGCKSGSAQLVANLTLHSWLAAGCTPGMAEVLETLPRQGVPMYTAVMKAYASLGKVATMFFLLAEETLSFTLLYLLRFNILASSSIFLSGIHSFARCRKSNQGSGFASENSPICRFR